MKTPAGNRKKILALSWSFAPANTPRAKQVQRVLTELHADVTVICELDPAAGTAPDVDSLFREVIHVPYAPSFSRRAADRLIRSLRLPAMHRLHQPDPQMRWNIKAFNEYSRRPGTYSAPDVLLTFGNPMSDNFIGLRYKKMLRIPWIAHFSDPWTDNPFVARNDMQRDINLRMERLVVESADTLIFTSPETIDLVMRKYPAELRGKAHYVPHCFDPALYDRSLAPPADRYVMRSLGNFYEGRTPAPLFEAVERISKESPGLLDKVDIELAGIFEKESVGIENKYPSARRFIKVTKPVPYLESINMMQTAHCLLAIDAPADFSVFFPSKLADYMGAGRFIFAITPPGASARIVTDLGGATAPPADPGAVASALKKILAEKPAALPRAPEFYSKENVAGIFMDIIDKTLKNAAG